jgi:hypothetical protein
MKNAFDILSLHDKKLLIEDMAIMVASIEHYDHRINLYALNRLFIEAYQNIDTRIIERITVADSTDLDKFLARITLPYYQLKRPPNHKSVL